MKKRITKIWGVSLVIILAVSLLLSAAPVSADDTLQFDTVTIPSTTDEQLTSDTIADFAVSFDGETVYAVATDPTVYKSTDGGINWDEKETTSGGAGTLSPTFVAVASDDSDVVAVADGTTVFISTNGGATWGSLGVPEQSGGNAVATIKDIDVSAEAGNDRYVAVAGIEDSSNVGNVWYYNIGKIGGSWKDSRDLGGASGNVTEALAVAFSPNFASDEVLTIVTENLTATYFEMLSLNTEEWNAEAGFDDFPVLLELSAGDNVTSPTHAAIALAPTYLGQDDVERVAFVAIDCNDAGDGGVYRLENTTDKALKTGIDYYSIAFDGNYLVAGEADSTTVWRCSDPLASTPTLYSTSNLKEPGDDDSTNTIVAWSGTNVVASVAGTNGAFAVSRDNGKSFNDVSLVNIAGDFTGMQDVAVSSDSSVTYLLTQDTATDIGLWRKSGREWERVLAIPDEGTDYIVRINPDMPESVYVALVGGTDVWYSSDSGDDKWFKRTTGSDTITDLAVESEDVAYIATGSKVAKTTNGGFTWGTPKSTEIGDLSMLRSLGEDLLITVDGDSTGQIAWSKDGNSSWTHVGKPFSTGSGDCHITASGLGDDDQIYAIKEGKDNVYRWRVGDSGAADFEELTPGIPSGATATGIGLVQGALYVVASDGDNSTVLRSLNPDNPGIRWSDSDGMAQSGADFGKGPESFRATVDGSNTVLYLVDIDNPELYSYNDTIATVGPALVGPAAGKTILVNQISGQPNNTPLSWSRPSDEVSKYEVEIAFDDAFDEIAVTDTAVTSVSERGRTGSTTVPGSSLNTGSTYYWHVRVASDGPIYSPWSETRSFTIEAGGAVVPVIGSPANGGTVTGTPAFSWSPVSGATMYEFQLSADTSFGSPLASAEVAQTGIQPNVTLDAGKTYFWRVRSVEPMGDWSTISNFTIAVPVEEKPPVVVEQTPPPQITIETPPAQEIVLPEQPAPVEPISQGLLWAVIIIGAILVIAVIVLILRTRRVA